MHFPNLNGVDAKTIPIGVLQDLISLHDTISQNVQVSYVY
jgi:hypothetical protein